MFMQYGLYSNNINADNDMKLYSLLSKVVAIKYKKNITVSMHRGA